MEFNLISEQDKYEKLWNVKRYRERSPGLRELDNFLTKCNPKKSDVILDVGCGTGQVVKALLDQGYEQAMGVDIATNAVNHQIYMEHIHHFTFGDYLRIETLVPDWIFCCDMLEHLPKDDLRPTMYKMSTDAKKGYYLQVPTFPDDGTNWREDLPYPLHHTVEDAEWWRKEFKAFFPECNVYHDTETRRVLCAGVRG